MKSLTAQIERFVPPMLRGATTVLLIRGGGGALMYATQVIIARWLGPEQFGVFSYAWSWAFVIAVFAGLGLPNSSVRFIPEYRARLQGAKLLEFATWARNLTLLVGLAAAIVIGLGAYLLRAHVNPAYYEALLLSLVAIPVLSLSVLQIQMARAVGFVVLAFLPEQVLRPIIFLAFGLGLVWLVDAVSAEQFIVLSFLSYLVIVVGQHRPLWRFFRAEATTLVGDQPATDDVRHWLRVSLPMIASSGATVVLTQSSIIMAGILMAPTDVAVYTAASRTALLITLITMSADAMSVPKVAALYAQKAHDKINQMIGNITLWTFLASLGVLFGIVLFGSFILRLFGDQYEAAYLPLVILCCGFTLGAAIAPVPAILNVTGHQDIVTVMCLVVVAADVLLQYVFITHFGIVGAAIATVTTATLYRASLLMVANRRLALPGTVVAGLRQRFATRS